MIESDVENILHSKNILAPYTNEGLSEDDDEEYEEQVEMNDGRIKRFPLMIAGTVDFDKHIHPLAVAILK
ncbi:unnamed protein product [Brachionus calyciflorus]|uniref:Uncharacterized protein n=1 Tax=Brachionus calyciflorus TaxID=104777 RepID=A0A814DIG4_9BILA|nr:unnamed protein product [Brachionus calyciflorus]